MESIWLLHVRVAAACFLVSATERHHHVAVWYFRLLTYHDFGACVWTIMVVGASGYLDLLYLSTQNAGIYPTKEGTRGKYVGYFGGPGNIQACIITKACTMSNIMLRYV